MAELSPYTLIDRISLLVTLYKKYIELRKSNETFDNFVFWGDMLLGDFDDVDKYMVDARQLFTNIHDLKRDRRILSDRRANRNRQTFLGASVFSYHRKR